MQDDLAKYRLKPAVNIDLADTKNGLDYIDNNSSEEEIDPCIKTQSLIEPPTFDRSTKVLKLPITVKYIFKRI